ncbi:DUF4262 domain-containing protein [Asticcacaulis sp. DXS10W]|uniref:DUF4262 domain-containing protein n=1 Tax=Asticcacaulis currens TaxID=2984210 RepID=A0ABT5IE16_9CAUL|nr:DUF4262 domain-containing protein [Asticcacaulis currens]
MADTERVTDYERKILRNVNEHGWFCVSVFDPEDESATFSYSVGFTETLGCPEFIIFGLNSGLMHSMLWEVFRQIRGGKMPADNEKWSNVLTGYECVSRTVHPTNIIRDYLNSAMWFWGDPNERGPLPAFQLVWPGVETRLFPWDKGCSEIVRKAQPPLYLPNSGA